MASIDNITVFNRIVAGVLKKLYSEFPKPIMLDSEELRREFEISDSDWWERRGGGNVIGSAIGWLGDEGFVRFSDSAGGGRSTAFANAVLTAKGLSALNRTPDSLEPKPTVGQRLKELSVVASTEVVTGLVQMALRQ